MIGLMKKDLYMLKGNSKTIAVIFLVFTILSFENHENLTFIPAFMSLMLMMSTFSYDEYNKSDAYLQTFPNGKKNVVISKYLTSIFITVLAILATLLITVSLDVIKEINIKESITRIIVCGTVILLLQAVIYPFIFKFGIEKGRIGVFVASFLLVALASVVFKNGIQIPGYCMTWLKQYGFLLFIIITMLTLFGSYKLSKNIYSKKEF